ncbi:MAG: Hsp20/alpha crystallin family protein [Pseudomonadaceae bacterium]|nr:Hsp20/alpha crystallin family protein [Pseudomonadaceae bacterium]
MNLIDKPSSVFDEFYRPFGSLFGSGLPSRMLTENDIWMPAVDIKREDGSYVIEMEAPGFKPEDIDVEAHENVLTIQGSRSSETEKKEQDYVRRERRTGQFVRRFNLPNGCTSDDIEAQVKDGVLHVRIPDTQTSEPKKIAIS